MISELVGRWRVLNWAIRSLFLVHLVLPVLLMQGCGGATPEPGEPARSLVACSYLPVATGANPEPELSEFEDCAQTNADGSLTLVARHLSNIAFDDDGLATLHADQGMAWVNRAGKIAWAFPYDNGPDYFVEGLARTVRDSKVGFVNRKLDVVIEPVWDFASPFEGGLAAVCQGCKSMPACPGCEHFEMVGGQWGYIDSTGAVVVPVSLPKDELPARESLQGAGKGGQR